MNDKCDVCGEEYPELILGLCPGCGYIMCTDCLEDECPKCDRSGTKRPR